MKKLILFLFLFLSFKGFSQKAVTVNVIVNNQVVTKIATKEQVIKGLTKTSITYQGNEVYQNNKGTYYALIPLNEGFQKKRLTITK